MLIDQRDAAAAGVDDLALGRPEVSDDQLDESRLAVAVLAEQHDAALAVDAHLRTAEEQRQRGLVLEAHALDLHRGGARAELAPRLEAEWRLRVLLQAERVC